METLLRVVHLVSCVLLIASVLVQSGKGAEISASFGGSSQTIFGSSGGATFITRFTSIMAIFFMGTSLGLTALSGQAKKSVFEGVTPPAQTNTGATGPVASPAATPSPQPAATPPPQAKKSK